MSSRHLDKYAWARCKALMFLCTALACMFARALKQDGHMLRYSRLACNS